MGRVTGGRNKVWRGGFRPELCERVTLKTWERMRCRFQRKELPALSVRRKMFPTIAGNQLYRNRRLRRGNCAPDDNDLEYALLCQLCSCWNRVGIFQLQRSPPEARIYEITLGDPQLDEPLPPRRIPRKRKTLCNFPKTGYRRANQRFVFVFRPLPESEKKF